MFADLGSIGMQAAQDPAVEIFENTYSNTDWTSEQE